MRHLILVSIALTLGQTAVAHETDSEPMVSQDQIKRAEELPQTTVLRRSKSDPNKIEVAFLGKYLPRGEKLDNLKFEPVSLDSEVTGIAFGSKELDKQTSTVAWRMGYARGGGGRSVGFVRGPRGGAAFVRGPRGGAVAGYRRPFVGGYRGIYGRGYGYGRGYYGGYGNGYYGGSSYADYGNSGGYGDGGDYGQGYYGNAGEYGNGYNGNGGDYGQGYYGNGGGYGGYGNPYYPLGFGNNNVWAYPIYTYVGYQYPCMPYWGFSDGGYDYAYSRW